MSPIAWIQTNLSLLLGAIAGLLLGMAVTAVSYEGISFLGLTLLKGVVSERIEAHQQKEQLKAFVRRNEADEALGEREAARAEILRRRAEENRQTQLDLVSGEASERDRFQEAQRLERDQRIRELEEQLSSETQECKPKVIIRNVEKLLTPQCGYPGDAKPSDSFLQQYNQLKR